MPFDGQVPPRFRSVRPFVFTWVGLGIVAPVVGFWSIVAWLAF